MKISRRVLIIMGKGLKLCCLMVLMRCFGTQGAEHIRASFSFVLQRSHVASGSFARNVSAVLSRSEHP